ncbi:MAG: hypothetical protein K9M45_08220, partial [Kiritimatiellales bacterium]|nr:hypothetical protein [Kiritimatiellales bacterium]
VETRNDSPSLLREAEIKQQKELERARALPKNNRGSLPLKREPTVPPVKDAASGLVEGKSPVATTSTVENVEEKPDQLEDADAEKKPIPSI